MKACCSVCFEDKNDCLPVSYPQVVELYEKLKCKPVSFAVCKHCFEHADREFLHTNLMDYFITHELYRWTAGEKDGIIKNNDQFHTLLETAIDNKVIYREEKRIRQIEGKRAVGFVSMLWSNRSIDYTPNAVYKNLFKNVFDRIK